MDFTPPSIQPTPISSIPSSVKLPIKRKNPNPNLIPTPFTDDDAGADHDVIASLPPAKSPRIWTEPDEIRLLQGLLNCSSQGFSFPRDLGIFYNHFSDGMPQPYSKSQLFEKLRRLRKKFRLISSRLSKGLDQSLLSPHDRALYDLSKQLWKPDRKFLPFAAANSNRKSIDNDDCKSNPVRVRVRVKVDCLPTLPSTSTAVLALPSVVQKIDNGSKINNIYGAEDVNIELERDLKMAPKEVKVKSFDGDFVTRTVADLVDQSLKEITTVIDRQRYLNLEKEVRFEKRWRDQRVAEFDVLAKRLKLLVEHSSIVGQ